MSNKLKDMIDPLAGGEYAWYVAGGGAAWWHITNHMYVWHGAHDWDYFHSVEALIFPSDIEGGARVQVACTFPSKQGAIGVSLSETSEAKFNEIVETHCEKIDGINLYKIRSIIARYETASDKTKEEKRDIRVGMMKLILAGQPITAQGVARMRPRGGNVASGIVGSRRRLADQ